MPLLATTGMGNSVKFQPFLQIVPNMAVSYMNGFVYLSYLELEYPRTDTCHFWQLVSSFSRFWQVTGVPKPNIPGGRRTLLHNGSK